MRLLDSWTFAVGIGLSVFFPFSATALIAVGDLDIPGVTESVVVVDGVAYVAGSDFSDPGSSGLRIIDVSDPTAPVELGAIDTPANASQVVVVDEVAYVANGNFVGSLRIIDVSDPTAPIEVGAIESLATVTDFAVSNEIAVVVEEFGCARGCTPFVSLRVFDVSNPAAPIELDALCEFLCGTRRVEMVGNLLYVARSASGGGGPGDVQIFDVSNPNAPVQIGLIEPRGAASDITVVDGLAYLEDIVSLRIIDVSNPAAPVDLGSLDDHFVRNVAVESGFPYLAHLRSGLRVADVSNPAAPVGLDGTLDPTYGARDVAIAGGLAYVVGESGLAVVDLSNPAFPVELSTINIDPFEYSAWAQAVAVEGGVAYVAARASRAPFPFKGILQLIGVSTPAAPNVLGAPLTPGASLTPGEANDVAVAGGFAYVADGDRPSPSFPKGLRVIDVSDPAFPTQLGSYEIPGPGRTTDVAVEGGLAYVVFRSDLLLIDVSNPAAPVGRGVFDPPEGVNGVAAAGGLAYVAVGQNSVGFGSLRVIDASNPMAPVELGAVNTPGGASTVTVAGGLAYVTADGLRVIDVSIPAAPVELGAVSQFGGSDNVAVAGGLAYVTVGDSLRVIDVSNPAAPVELGGVGGLSEDVAAVDGLAYVVGGRDLRIIDFGPEYTPSIQIDADIKPGSDSNSINPSLEGDLPVAILGSDSFAVADVDVTTLVFGPKGASFDHSHGPHFEDLNGDGFTDLMAHFRIEDTGIAFGERMACLSGEVLDGTPFGGCDDVRTVPDMDGDKLPDVAEVTVGTHALNPDTDRDGFEDGEEVLEMGTDPLDAMDPAPAQNRGPRKRGKRRR